MCEPIAYQLPNRSCLNIHLHQDNGKLATLTIANYLSESFCIGGSITVFDPKLMAKVHSNTKSEFTNSIFFKNDITGSGMRFRITPEKNGLPVNTPLPLEMAVRLYSRRKVQYTPKAASIFCPTLQMLSSLALKKMPREFKTPDIAEVAIPIFANEARKWDKPITLPEISLPCLWHVGEDQGYKDEDFVAKCSTYYEWQTTLNAFRKLRTRNGFPSSPKLLVRNAPGDHAPRAYMNRINEILEAIGQPTVDDHHLHRLLGCLFCWGFDLALFIT